MNENELLTEGRRVASNPDVLIETILTSEIPQNTEFIIIAPMALYKVHRSRNYGGLWDAFLTVINKMSNKKYTDEYKRKTSMNTMLCNEFMKRKIEVRLSNV